MYRGESDPIQIASLQSKTPGDFRQRVLNNSQNKARLIELMFDYIKTHKNECLHILKCETIVVAGEESCYAVTEEEITEISEVESTQEEDDAKIILHANFQCFIPFVYEFF